MHMILPQFHLPRLSVAIRDVESGLMKTEPTALAAGPAVTDNQHVRPEASAYG